MDDQKDLFKFASGEYRRSPDIYKLLLQCPVSVFDVPRASTTVHSVSKPVKEPSKRDAILPRL